MSAAVFLALALCLQFSEASQSTSEKQFAAFIAKHGRAYEEGTEHYNTRFALFQQRIDEVESHNSRPDRSWTAASNHLSDWTEAELKMLRGWRGGHAPGSRPKRSGASFLQVKAVLKPLPESASWTHLKSSNTVLNQGACGSCWAIATVSAMNMHAEIYGTNRTYSAKEVVDCTPNPDKCGGKGGCDGATVELAMNYILNSGVSTAEMLPYQDSGSVCNSQSLATRTATKAGSGLQMGAVGVRMAAPGALGLAVGLQGWERLPENEMEPLMHAVAERGPVAISVAADGWNSYSDGIFDSCKKDAVIDHAVTLIGYSQEPKGAADDGKMFWLIQNSWGSSWGHNGRIKMLRHVDTKAWCGVDKQPEIGTGCDGGPSVVPVCGMCGILYDNVVPLFK